jgi:hypothetical protein
MIVVNFFHIKRTNGLFFYGLDYARENLDLIRCVIVRPELEHRAKAELPGVQVVICSKVLYLLEILRAYLRKDLLYTPTSHPIPLVNLQWIVLHDAYPFKVGTKAKLKSFLLNFSLSISRCRVGYINRSEALPFVVSLGVVTERLVFAPNRFPKPVLPSKLVPSSAGITTVGLLGTDSEKKNYACFFKTVRLAGLASRLAFRVYGHDTAYFREVQLNFPDIKIELVASDNESIDNFMSGVDVLTSASEHEGFGRPFASALLAGMSVELLDRPVFREFFNGGARFHSNLVVLVQSLARSGHCSPSTVCFSAPLEVVGAYAKANEEIRRLGSISHR